MKKKAVQKLLVLSMAGAMITGMAMPAFAASNDSSTVKGGTTTFDKYLTMESQANVPNVTFSWTIANGTRVEGTASTPEVYAGVSADKVKIYQGTDKTAVNATFAQGQTTYADAQSGDQITLAATDKYAKDTMTVDFSNVTFENAGIYRYVITESASKASGITNDATSVRYMDVYVGSADDGTLSIKGYLLHTSTDAAETADSGTVTATKDKGWTNDYDTADLTLEKQVTGNQGNRDEHFTFTVSFTGATAGTVYDVDLSGAESSDGNASITVGSDGSASYTVQLKDDEKVKIQGIAPGTSYTIKETAKSGEGYDPSFVQTGTTLSTAKASVTGTTDTDLATTSTKIGSNDDIVTFTNYRNGVVPTGIMNRLAPSAGVIAAVAAAFTAFGLTRKRRRADEE